MKRTIIEIDEDLCDGCGICVPACHEGALAVIDGKARLRSESLCDGIGDCIGDCPQGAIRKVERETLPFDEPPAASRHPETASVTHARGCPGSQVIQRRPAPAGAAPAVPGESLLGHWPIKIRLVPPEAPFLRDADLVVAADCTAVALPDFHRRYAAGAVLIGCPKFEPLEEATERFRRILRGSVRRVTVVVMEVPCCQGLVSALLQAYDSVGCATEIEAVVIGVDGELRTRSILRGERKTRPS